MSEAAEQLRTATREIWTRPPAGLAELAAMHRPPSGDLPKRLYANFDVYWGAGCLYQLREMADDPRIDPRALALISAGLARTTLRRLQTWGFSDAATAVESAVNELSAASDRATIRTILAELIVFLNRLHVWIDSSIPWADMDALAPNATETEQP